MIKKEPLELINFRRFDLIPKIIYGQYRKNNIKSKWAKNLYEEHIRVFNGAYEVYPVKKGVEEFVRRFDNLLDSVKKNGFKETEPVLISRNNVLIEGAHRVAAGLVHEKPVICEISNKKEPNYDSYYFKNKVRYVPGGLDEKWSDAIALEYCRLKKNTHIAIIFPSAAGNNEEIKKILNKNCNIVYEKTIILKNQGPFNLIKQVYSNEEWLGNWENNFRGARRKMNNCFANPGVLRVFLIETDDLKKLNESKEEIRRFFKIGNHSIHTNDSHEDTIKLAQIFFNNNSIHFLNYSNPVFFKNFNSLFERYEKWINENNYNPEYFCISGSAVMSIYGLRDISDLDFFHYQKDIPLNKNEDINSHNSEVVKYEKEVDDFIFNPENHFYFNGIKFLSLDCLKKMKLKRNELKDQIDLKIIEGLKEENKLNEKRKYSLMAKIINTRIFQKFNFALNKMHSLSFEILNKLK